MKDKTPKDERPAERRTLHAARRDGPRHDTTFECIAESFKVEIYRERMPAMLTWMCQRLLS